MKAVYIKIVFCLMAISFAFNNSLHAQIFLDGVVFDYTEKGGPVQVTVFEDGVVTKKTETNNKGKYRVRLQPNHKYTIAHSKEGFYTSQIAINTAIPYEENNSEFFKEILVEVDLVESHVEMDEETMRKPLSVFTYNESTGLFVQNDENLQAARNELEAFLYEADDVDSEDTELADTDTDKDIETDVDPFEGIDFDTVEVYTATKNTEKKTYKQLDEEERERKERNTSNKDRSSALASNNTTSKNNSGSTNANPTANKQNKQLTDTTAQDTIETDTTEMDIPEPTPLNLTIKINGKEYIPNQQKKIVVDDDEVEIEVIGLPEDEDYSFLEYQLSGKESKYIVLDSDQLEYDDLEAGSYTFQLRNTRDADFTTIQVPFEVEEKESDNTWIYVVLGAIVAIIVVVLVTRKKKEEDRNNLHDRDLR